MPGFKSISARPLSSAIRVNANGATQRLLTEWHFAELELFRQIVFIILCMHQTKQRRIRSHYLSLGLRRLK